MAGRPHKQGLDYFSFDTDFFDRDPKIFELSEIHNDSGLIFLQKLFCWIYRNGNYMTWDKSVSLQFRKQYHYTPEICEMYLQTILDLKLLDPVLYRKHKVLTSASIQDRYIYATIRRQKVQFVDEYLLIDFDSYRRIPNDIEIYNTDGEFLRTIPKRSVKDAKKAGKLKPKHKSDEPDRKVDPKGVGTPIIKMFTHKQVLEFIKKPWEDHDEVLRDSTSKEEFDAFVTLNKIIDAKFDNIRVSTRQMSFFHYLELMEESKPTTQELHAALRKISGLGIMINTDIYNRLSEGIDMIRNQNRASNGAAPKEEATVDHPEYYREKVLEDQMLQFWGFNTIANPDKEIQAVQFLTSLNNSERLDHFKLQFKYYKEWVGLRGAKFRCSWKNFLGKQEDRFADGKWNEQNWAGAVSAEIVKTSSPDKQVVSKAAQAINSHDNFMENFRRQQEGSK